MQDRLIPTLGGGTWTLTDEQIAKWQEFYVRVDVKEECGKALMWLDANPAKLKKNAKRFLVNWLNTATQRANEARIHGAYFRPPGAEPVEVMAWSEAYLGARDAGKTIAEAVEIAKKAQR